MSTTKDDESIPEAMRRLLDLFASDLADLRFGDLDATALDRAASAVRAAVRELEEAEALADAARSSLATTREGLVHLGQRALAYARIYAEGSPELAERLEAIVLPGGPRRAEPKAISPGVPEASPRRRGRPPKPSSPAATGTLELGPAASRHANGADDVTA
jgi:hypothetical protein